MVGQSIRTFSANVESQKVVRCLKRISLTDTGVDHLNMSNSPEIRDTDTHVSR